MGAGDPIAHGVCMWGHICDGRLPLAPDGSSGHVVA